MCLFFGILLLAFFLMTNPAKASSDVDYLLEAYRNSTGVDQFPEPPTSMTLKGVLEQQGVSTPFRLYKRGGDKMRIEWPRPDGTTVVMLVRDGYAWQWHQTNQSVTQPPRKLTDQESHGLLVELPVLDPFLTPTPAFEEQQNMTAERATYQSDLAKHVDSLTTKLGNDVTVRAYLNVFTRLKEVQSYEVAGTPSVFTYYDDYRQVGRLRLPFRIETRRSGQLLNRITVEEVSINPSLFGLYFELPRR
jgi:hypothetical protein